MSELSYQECGNTGVLVFEHSCKLSEKELTKLLPFIRLSDFERYRRDKIPLEEKKIVGFIGDTWDNTVDFMSDGIDFLNPFD